MKKAPFLFALAATAMLTGCKSNDQNYEAKINQQNIIIKEYEAENAALSSQNSSLSAENKRKASEIKYLTNKNAALATKVESLAEEMKEILKNGGIPGISVSKEGNLVGESDFFFAPGKASLTKSGLASMKALAEKIKGYGHIQVAGHTDVTPLVKTKKIWGDNLNLSAARAVSVARTLIKAGVPASKVSIAGFGEHKPAASGKTKADLKKNRRVEIKVLK